jgi:steroid delta-isomerase-like uncharacterized protein
VNLSFFPEFKKRRKIMQPAPAMESSNAALMRRVTEELWNKGNLALADEVFAQNFINHDPDNPDLPRGPAGVRQSVTATRKAFPNLRVTIEDIIAKDNTVVVRWNVTATHQGEYRGIAPTEKNISYGGIIICRIENDKFQEIWWARDTIGLMRQLGAIAK